MAENQKIFTYLFMVKTSKGYFNKMNILLKNTDHWSNFDTSNFPNIKVKLNEKIKNDDDFNHFLNSWSKLYDGEKYFNLDFDTEDVGTVHIKYANRMRGFIKMLKKDKPRLLTASYIRVNSSWVRFLLKFIFMFEKPVAPVYIHNFDPPELENLKQCVESKEKLPKDVTVYYP